MDLQKTKKHFNRCVDEGLTIGETEEKLLNELYTTIEQLEEEQLWLYGKLNMISQIIEEGRNYKE